MHEIMHTLGFGHSFDLTASEIMGSSSPGSYTGDPGDGESQDSAVGGDAVARAIVDRLADEMVGWAAVAVGQ